MSKDPAYRRLKEKRREDRAFVELNGKRIYLGKYGTKESRKEYHRVLAEWMASGRQLPIDQEEITVVELIARFWAHDEKHYRKPDGTPTGSAENFRLALRPLNELYGDAKAAGFGPRALKAVRQRMIDAGHSRGYINSSVGKIKQVFKWGVAEELIPPHVYHALQAVSGLQRGRTGSRVPSSRSRSLTSTPSALTSPGRCGPSSNCSS